MATSSKYHSLIRSSFLICMNFFTDKLIKDSISCFSFPSVIFVEHLLRSKNHEKKARNAYKGKGSNLNHRTRSPHCKLSKNPPVRILHTSLDSLCFVLFFIFTCEITPFSPFEIKELFIGNDGSLPVDDKSRSFL